MYLSNNPQSIVQWTTAQLFTLWLAQILTVPFHNHSTASSFVRVTSSNTFPYTSGLKCTSTNLAFGTSLNWLRSWTCIVKLFWQRKRWQWQTFRIIPLLLFRHGVWEGHIHAQTIPSASLCTALFVWDTILLALPSLPLFTLHFLVSCFCVYALSCALPYLHLHVAFSVCYSHILIF